MQRKWANAFLSEETIENYLQKKIENGVSWSAVRKYKAPLIKLYHWLPEEKQLTSEILKEWRTYLESQDYSKITIQNHVKIVNDFLRTSGHSELCIPKPLRRDFSGKTFGYLTVIEPTEKRHRKDVVWRCICKCGTEIEVPATMLAGGNTTSCGCLKTEILQQANRYVEGTSLRQSLEDKPLSTRAVSGYTGVHPKRGKWMATITYKKKCYRLGTFSKLEDAVAARARAKERVMEDAAKLYEEYEKNQKKMQGERNEKQMYKTVG